MDWSKSCQFSARTGIADVCSHQNGYLIAIAFFGLFQAIFMANAGGAWDNAKKIVEVDLKAKGTPLHARRHRGGR